MEDEGGGGQRGLQGLPGCLTCAGNPSPGRGSPSLAFAAQPPSSPLPSLPSFFLLSGPAGAAGGRGSAVLPQEDPRRPGAAAAAQPAAARRGRRPPGAREHGAAAGARARPHSQAPHLADTLPCLGRPRPFPAHASRLVRTTSAPHPPLARTVRSLTQQKKTCPPRLPAPQELVLLSTLRAMRGAAACQEPWLVLNAAAQLYNAALPAMQAHRYADLYRWLRPVAEALMQGGCCAGGWCRDRGKQRADGVVWGVGLQLVACGCGGARCGVR